VDKIKSGLTKKVLGLLEKMASKEPENYHQFYQNFGIILKEGFTEDTEHQPELKNLLRFSSTFDDLEAPKVSLSDYLKRMPTEQQHIYYIISDNFNAARNSPHLEVFRKKGIEVLLLSDRVDEWMMAYLKDYEGKQFKSITQEDLSTEELNQETPPAADTSEPQDQQALETLLADMKTILANKVKAVKVSKRLTDSPSCLVSEAQGMSLHLQRLMQEAGQMLPPSQPILEINAGHPFIKKLLAAKPEEKVLQDWTELLYEQALLAEGGQLQDPGSFVKRLNKLIQTNHNF